METGLLINKRNKLVLKKLFKYGNKSDYQKNQVLQFLWIQTVQEVGVIL